MERLEHPLRKYLRTSELPLIFCPGCGSGQVLNYTLRAIDELGLDTRNLVFLSGSGCNGWIAPAAALDVLHTNHGRPIAYATGVKVANPSLKVVVFTGDGDSAAIGANHLVQAARRNIEMVVLCINNSNYGMTGGQLSPTTPRNAYTTTTPYGNPEPPFDLCYLVAAAGASFVARWTTYHARQLIKTIKKVLQKKGFAFIDIISQCPTQYGRRLGFSSPAEMLRYFKEKAVRIDGPDGLGRLSETTIPVGEFVNKELPEFTEKLRQINAEAMARRGSANVPR